MRNLLSRVQVGRLRLIEAHHRLQLAKAARVGISKNEKNVNTAPKQHKNGWRKEPANDKGWTSNPQ